MLGKQDLGSRIRRARKERDLTLKNLETRSGVSATHLSEIERGLTSPTLHVLARIAAALGRTTPFFLEDRWLETMSRTPAGSRPADEMLEAGARATPLTEGIAGHRLEAYVLHLDAGGPSAVRDTPHAGDEAVHVLSGNVRLVLGGSEVDLEACDSAVFRCGQPHAIHNASAAAPAELVWVCSRRRRPRSGGAGATGATRQAPGAE